MLRPTHFPPFTSFRCIWGRLSGRRKCRSVCCQRATHASTRYSAPRWWLILNPLHGRSQPAKGRRPPSFAAPLFIFVFISVMKGTFALHHLIVLLNCLGISCSDLLQRVSRGALQGPFVSRFAAQHLASCLQLRLYFKALSCTPSGSCATLDACDQHFVEGAATDDDTRNRASCSGASCSKLI